LKYKPMFDKIKISNEELEKITNQWYLYLVFKLIFYIFAKK
jgi:hypothetical protein